MKIGSVITLTNVVFEFPFPTVFSSRSPTAIAIRYDYI